MDLHYLELTELADLLRRRELTSVEVTRAQLARIDCLDSHLASYARVTAEQALSAAEAADAELAVRRYRGLLHGVPLGIKDLFWMKGVPAAAGTMIRSDFVPAEDASVVSRLKQAGAVLLGKLQMTEGAYSDHHPAITPPKNPWNAEYWTGISSSGSAAATAAGLCYGSLASDTGGSIRWPCGATGLSGIKPAWGRVSRHGAFELAATLDHVGPIARPAADAAAIFAIIAGPDANDPTTFAEPELDYAELANTDMRGVRLGIDPRWNTVDVHTEVQSALTEAERVFQQLGAEIVWVSVPDVTQAVLDWASACALEAGFAYRETYPLRKDRFGPVLASVLDAGHAISAFDYQAIRLRRRDLRGRFAHLLRSIDGLLVPVQPYAPPDAH